MKVIIIEDKDARALVKELEFQYMKEVGVLLHFNQDDVATKQTVADIHRAFHYVVVRWLQDQGCETTK